MSEFTDFFSMFEDQPGDIIAMSTEVVPPRYLECNGAAISRTAYAELFAALGTFHGIGDGSTTFNIPDLRGKFLRATDESSGIDPGAAARTRPSDSAVVGDVPGSQQAMNLANHVHIQGGATTAASGGTYNFARNGVATSDYNTQTGDIRPINASVMYCVRYMR